MEEEAGEEGQNMKESMCSAPFLTISEKLVAQGRPGP